MMNLNKQIVWWIMVVFLFLSVLLCCVCYCSPVNYREVEVVEVTTTPRMYRDRFTYKMLHKTKSNLPNDSFADNAVEPYEMRFRERNGELENVNFSKVKSVMPGEKTMRQSDEEDDDDDDGGEYEGFDFSRDDKADRRRVQVQAQQCGRSDPAGAMPMMIIRELDMVAVQFPMKDPQNGQSERAKEWSEWSPCSRPCRGGKGLQSRWRVQHGVQDKEQQYRPCYLADCGSRDFKFRPSFL